MYSCDRCGMGPDDYGCYLSPPIAANFNNINKQSISRIPLSLSNKAVDVLERNRNRTSANQPSNLVQPRQERQSEPRNMGMKMKKKAPAVLKDGLLKQIEKIERDLKESEDHEVLRLDTRQAPKLKACTRPLVPLIVCGLEGKEPVTAGENGEGKVKGEIKTIRSADPLFDKQDYIIVNHRDANDGNVEILGDGWAMVDF